MVAVQGHIERIRQANMEVQTSRFHRVAVEPVDIFRFPGGIVGMEHCRQWTLLEDPRAGAVAWLQSVEHADLALAVVSPRRFVPGYQIHVGSGQLQALQLNRLADAELLAVVGRCRENMTLNLKAPLVINLSNRLGCQVIVNDPYCVQHKLPERFTRLRMTA